MPHILNWVYIGALGGRPPPSDAVVFKEFVCTFRRVLRIIVLHKSISLIDSLAEGNQTLFQNLCVHLGIHNTIKGADFSATIPANSGPDMNFNRMLGSWLVARFLTILAATKASVGLKLYR